MRLSDIILDIRLALGEPSESMLTDEQIQSYLNESYEITQNTYRTKELTLKRLRESLGLNI